jgi:hypothetical protein
MKLLKTLNISGITYELYLIGETKVGGWTHKILKKVTLENGRVTEERYQGKVIEDIGELKIVLGHRYR